MAMRVRLLTLFTALLLSEQIQAQKLDPVQWTLEAASAAARPGDLVTFHLTAKVEPGWHLYSLTTPKGGPIPTTATAHEGTPLAAVEVYQPTPERHFDPNFNIDTETFAEELRLLVSGTVPKGAKAGVVEVELDVRYQVCSDRQCLPPRRKTATVRITVDPKAAAGALVVPNGYSAVTVGPVAKPQTATRAPQDQSGLPLFTLTAFGLGLAAVFTPCVFPMITITVSFFLSRRGGLAQAAIFSSGIVVLFCAIGLGITFAAGPFGVVKMAANPWVNGFIAAVFTAFALSLLGAYEISLPSGILTKIDSIARQEGSLGTLLMGLTFSLTAFACVGPFVGSLLAASVQAPGIQPVLGMFSFAVGLSAPFFLLAAFPSFLKKLPKSGDWMLRIKVVMGFILLAVMLKYLSNIDQVLQLGLLTRERFLAAWLAISTLTGLYLLGLLHLHGNRPGQSLGVPRLLLAGLMFAFGFSLMPAMSGARLGELDAYIHTAQLSPNAASSAETLAFMKDKYPEALAKARAEGRPVLVTFTGYACTNCHWMKANLFTQPEVAAAMKKFVLVDLYTDGSDASSVENQKLQEKGYGTVAIPFYAIVGPQGSTVSTFPGLTRDSAEWQSFLHDGMAKVTSLAAVTSVPSAAN
ncbi:MAG: protein-disulfide reductase DsbD domain-containing protein [Bryobacteraceae bacterium]